MLKIKWRKDGIMPQELARFLREAFAEDDSVHRALPRHKRSRRRNSAAILLLRGTALRVWAPDILMMR